MNTQKLNIDQYQNILKAFIAYLKKNRLDSCDMLALETEYNQAVRAAIAYLQKNVRHDVFNLAAMGSEHEAIQVAQAENITLLHQFLDHTIDKNRPPRFLEKAAPGVQAAVIDSTLTIEKQLYIYDAPQHLGIREKYIRGMLSDKHRLTDLDIQYMLRLTKCNHTVHALSLAVDSLAAVLDIAQKNIASKTKNEQFIDDKQNNYTIPFILRYPDGKNGEPYWFTAKVFYNSLSGEISYQVTDLPQEQHDECKKIIEAAITRSFEGKALSREKISVTSPEAAAEPQRSGYHALHHLFQSMNIQTGLVDPEHSDDLIRYFFDLALADLKIPIEMYDAFAQKNLFKKPIVENPTHADIDREKLALFLTTLQAQTVLAPQLVEQAVSEGIGSYAIGTQFLGSPNADHLDAIQYTHFFSELSEIVLKSGINLPVMHLTHGNEQALKGLNYFLAISNAPFDVLQINISSDKEVTPVFINNLQLALQNLSQRGLTKLKLIDNGNRLTTEHYEQLLKFIAEKEIAIKIDLPDALTRNTLQREIDHATGINIRNKNSNALQSSVKQKKKEALEKKNRVVRQRENGIAFKEISVDLEVAANISETVVIKPTEIRQRQLQEYANFQKFTIDDLSTAISSTEITAFDKFQDVAGGLSKAAFVKYWHDLSTNITHGELKLGKPTEAEFIEHAYHMGKQRVYINSQFNGFTSDALARLIQFKEYFSDRDGINIDQLPAGFILIPDPNDPKTILLHYDAMRDEEIHLTPHLIEKKPNDILSIDVTEKLFAEEHAPAALKKIWNTLQTGEYSRKESESLRQHVLELLDLTPKQLDTVITLCGGVKAFKYNTLDFIFNHLNKAKLAYATPYNEDNLVSIKWMAAYFPEPKDRETFVTLAHEINPHVIEQHALFSLLNQEGTTKLEHMLAKATKDYQLTHSELNQLLRLYDKYGMGGLEKLLIQWENIHQIIPLPRLPAITKHATHYEQLLVNEDVLLAVKAISQFDNNTRQWWDRLYEAHTPKEDDFLIVYKNFTHFMQAIAQYNLTFYDLSSKGNVPLFVGSGNLPHTVGRILSILNSCTPSERELQWKAMSEINISSQGALRAMTHAKINYPERRCGFVLPEMNLDTKLHFDNRIYDPSTPWYAVAMPFNDRKEQMAAFYNYIAYQNHRLPLAFYQEAVDKIDAMFPEKKLPLEARGHLYALLLASTTGDNYRFYTDSPQAAMAQWESLLKEIQNVNVSSMLGGEKNARTIRKTTLEHLLALPKIPALPILQRLTTLLMAPLHEISTTQILSIRSKVNKLIQCNNRLRRLLYKYNDKVYQGMRFYENSDYKDPRLKEKSLFEHYLDVSDAIDEQGGAPEFRGFLLRNVSTFHIIPAELDALFEALKLALKRKACVGIYPEMHEKTGRPIPEYDSSFSKELFHYAIKLLKNIQSIKKPDGKDRLTVEDLKQFIVALGDEIDKLLTNMDQELNSAYKSHHLDLAKLEDKKTKINDNIIALIQQYENEGKIIDWDLPEFSTPLKRKQKIAEEISELESIDINANVFKKNKNQYKEQLVTFVETRLGTHFATNYFTNKRAGEASPHIQLLIDRAFIDNRIKESVESIRQQFDKKSTESQQLNMLTLLEAMSRDLSHSNTLKLVEYLRQPSLTEAPIEDYLALAKAINEKGTSSFMYFMQSTKKFPNANHLAEKATFFLQNALPAIRNSQNKLTNESDLIDLAIDTVLAANANELKDKYEINTTYLNLKHQLGASNAHEIVAAITTEMEETIPDIKELKNHLTWLSKEEIEIYTITPEKREHIKIEKKGTSHTLTRGIGKIASIVGIKATRNLGYDYVEKVTPAIMGERIKQKNTDKTLLEHVSKALDPLIQEASTYAYAFSETFALINKLIVAYPGAKIQILEHCRHYLSFNTTDGSQIMEAFTNIKILNHELAALDNQNLVIGLCENFGPVKTDLELLEHAPFDYQMLLDIFKGNPPFEQYPGLNADAKKQILIIINSLLNNKKPCTLSHIEELINQCCASPLYQQMLAIVFANAPFPTFTDLNRWFMDATNSSDQQKAPLDHIKEEYKRWNHEPVQRETKHNGFILEDAQKQNELIQGFKYEAQQLEAIHQAVNGTKENKGVKHLDTKDILAEISAIRESVDLQKAYREDPTRLVALMAELLYRTKGLEANGDLGRSFEINTTQYLAIHSMLKAGGHVTSQIATGEGKSRIMMLSLACQYALGHTVDFVTADVSLATRDYLEYQSFFKAMGAETRLITAEMPADQYKIGGIHFSDPTHLSLFRNKARSEGRWAEVIAPEKKKRALMLDEADKVYFDCSDRRFNYSAQANPHIRDMEWIYELLIEFFSQDNNTTLYKRDADACNEAFINFARGKLSHYPERIARLEYNPKIPMPVISRNQLESWQNAALTALELDLGDKFTLIENISIKTKEGQAVVSQAQLRSGEGRAIGAAKMSFGVHQCLHARLNMVRTGRLPHDKLAQRGLEKLEHPFYMDPETQIVYSSTSKSLLDDYNEGELLAVTGTAGGIREQEEAMKAFGKDGGSMTFIDIPRHRHQQRIDRPFLLAHHQNDHMQKILKAVLKALEKNQPLLLICENDNESQNVFNFLENNLTPAQKATLERISAETDLKKEAKHIEKHAGQPGAITVSTAMLGRGTDIKLFGAANTHGLHVIGTYLPRERDYWQIVGRAGRFGAQGESELILNKERLAEQIKEYTGLETHYAQNILNAVSKALGKTNQPVRLICKSEIESRLVKEHLQKNLLGDHFKRVSIKTNKKASSEPLSKQEKPSNAITVSTIKLGSEHSLEFYTATEEYLKMLQEKMDAKAQKYRVIKDVVNDYRQVLMHQFFDNFKKNLPEENDVDAILSPWQQFFDKSDKFWNELFPKIQDALAEQPINIESINNELRKYHEALQSDWSAMRADFEVKIDSGKIKVPAGKIYATENLKFNAVPLDLSEHVLALLQVDQSQKCVLQTRIADHYDPAYVGRAVIYKNAWDGFLAFFKNIAAAWRGDGPWFPNLKATQNKNMSWSQFFFGTWGVPLTHIEPKASFQTLNPPAKHSPKDTLPTHNSYASFIDKLHNPLDGSQQKKVEQAEGNEAIASTATREVHPLFTQNAHPHTEINPDEPQSYRYS